MSENHKSQLETFARGGASPLGISVRFRFQKRQKAVFSFTVFVAQYSRTNLKLTYCDFKTIYKIMTFKAICVKKKNSKVVL